MTNSWRENDQIQIILGSLTDEGILIVNLTNAEKYIMPLNLYRDIVDKYKSEFKKEIKRHCLYDRLLE